MIPGGASHSAASLPLPVAPRSDAVATYKPILDLLSSGWRGSDQYFKIRTHTFQTKKTNKQPSPPQKKCENHFFYVSPGHSAWSLLYLKSENVKICRGVCSYVKQILIFPMVHWDMKIFQKPLGIPCLSNATFVFYMGHVWTDIHSDQPIHGQIEIL